MEAERLRGTTTGTTATTDANAGVPVDAVG